MNGQHSALAKSFGVDEYIGGGAFQCNGLASPVAGTGTRFQRGFPFTCVHSGTGFFTLTFAQNLRFPRAPVSIIASIQAALADYASVLVVANNLATATPNIQLQLHRTGIAQTPPAVGLNDWISFLIIGSNNTGA